MRKKGQSKKSCRRWNLSFRIGRRQARRGFAPTGGSWPLARRLSAEGRWQPIDVSRNLLQFYAMYDETQRFEIHQAASNFTATKQSARCFPLTLAFPIPLP